MEDFKSKILRIFKNHTTPGTALTRRQLEIEFMSSDRAVREIVIKARKIGIPIASSSRNTGYWLNKRDFEAMTLPEYISRVRSDMEVIKAYKGNDPNQISIYEVV